jgi:hypothetical protein
LVELIQVLQEHSRQDADLPGRKYNAMIVSQGGANLLALSVMQETL